MFREGVGELNSTHLASLKALKMKSIEKNSNPDTTANTEATNNEICQPYIMYHAKL